MAEDARDEPPSAPTRRPNERVWPWLLALIVLTGAAFLPVLDADFTNWDDSGYVVSNPYLRDVSLEGTKALFTSYYKGNYHPLSMVSLALDYRLGGLNPGVYHATNLLLHLLNTLLVFALTRKLLHASVGGFIAALLFGLHPMHVESVAWISERKDVLYAFFFLCSVLAYLRCLDEPTHRQRNYGLSLGAFLLSLLSKGMAVALAPTLLAFDMLRGRDLRRPHLWIEKIPYFGLALIFGIVALGAQTESGQLQGASHWSPLERIALASYAYVQYLLKLIAPLDLSAFYPYPTRIDGGLPASFWLYPLLVCAIAALFVWALTHARVLAFGIGFFTLNVLFVLQLVPVGGAIMADRYSYVASIGLCVPVAAVAMRAFEQRRALGAGLLLALGLYLAFLGWTTYQRTAVWHDSLSLWDDVIAQHTGIDIAHLNRGLARYEGGDLEGAELDFSEAIAISPEYGRAWAHRGVIRHQLGQTDAGLRDLTRALVFEPSAETYSNRGSLRLEAGNAVGAIADFDRAIALQPGHVMAYNNRGYARAAAGDPLRALADFRIALSMAPGLAAAQLGAGEAQLALGDASSAERHFEAALILLSDPGPAHFGRGRARMALGKRAAGCEDLREAARSTIDGAAAAVVEQCEPEAPRRVRRAEATERKGTK